MRWLEGDRLARLSAAQAVLLLLGATAPARAAPAEGAAARREAAQAALTRGNQLVDQGDYRGALDAYQSADTLFPAPKLQFNIGQAYRGLGAPVEALEAFERFLADSGDATPGLRAEAQSYMLALEPTVGRVALVASVAEATVLVDGRPRGRTPLARPLAVMPGPHRLRLEKPGFAPDDRSVEVAAGAELSVEVRLARLAPPAARLVAVPAALPAVPPESPRRPITRRWWFWSGIAVVLAGAALGVFYLTRPQECPAASGRCYAPTSTP